MNTTRVSFIDCGCVIISYALFYYQWLSLTGFVKFLGRTGMVCCL